MRHGATFFAVSLSLAVVGLGAFFTVIGLATVTLGGPDRFASWLAFGLVVMAIGLVALGVVWTRRP
jgi:hypothetical protein